ncbi:MAG TPA: SCO family protein [Candidatus Krumholzibacteria bacterium]|nr:SCO family protein [Candidatus Krumholzibacteria bacterium]HRY39581.1 SCO family protein [Candidatus Krumholzibacteria bacterium]
MQRWLPILAACALAMPASAQDHLRNTDPRGEPLPDELAGVGVTEKLAGQVPLDLRFRDEDGQAVALAAYFDGARPVILNLGYLGCPMLCGLVANGLVDALRAIDHTVGEEFTVVSVSIDPTETPVLAKAKKQGYLREYGRPAAAQGWHWLTGDEDQIRALTDAVGFGYRWNERRQEYAHAAVLVVLSPDGRVMRYLYGIQFDPRTLKLSLVEAADGRTGNSLDRFLLFCFHYDAETGRYGPAARNLMKVGGAVTVLVVGASILAFRRRELRAARSG